MKETEIVEEEKVTLSKPLLIEGLPGLGYVGKIAVTFLIQHLKAKRFASLYSPHFPYYVLSEEGRVRLLRLEFYHARVGNRDLVLLTGDCQPTTSAGQYEVAASILDFSRRHKVRLLVTLGGFSGTDEKRIVGASTSDRLLEKLKQEGVKIDLSDNPIVGTTGILLSLARFKGIEALCLLGETPGYAPSLKPAKKILALLSEILGLKIDLKQMDRRIAKFDQLKGRLAEIAEEELPVRREETVSYIS
ncbi:MAG: PAC2 family protein [Candidatus Bathyarchaeia archaeon]